MIKRMIHFGIVLGLVCVAAALGVAGTYRLTRGPIEKRKEDKQAALLELLFGAAGAVPAGVASGTGDDRIYKGDAGGRTVAYAAVGSGQGYSSRIKVLVATDVTLENVLAIVVTDQAETPGLGTQIEDVKPDATWADVVTGKKSPVKAISSNYEPPRRIDSLAEFQQQFSASWRHKQGMEPLSTEGIALGSGVDGITGATISSRAVVTAVNEAVKHMEKTIEPKAP